MDNYKSAAPKGEGKAATGRQPPPLKTLEDISCIIESPKRKTRDTQKPDQSGHRKIMERQIQETLQWVLSQSLNMQRQ